MPLPSAEARGLFVDTGLIHLMVVSGAHLIFLERALDRLPLGPRGTALVLTIYAWLTGFGAPVVKALVRRVLEPRTRARGWGPLQTEALAVVCTLAFVPEWFLSRSFQMSWVCAVALALPTMLRPRVLDEALRVHVLIWVFAGGASTSIFWNALLAPLVGALLFPLCLLVAVLPWLVPLGDLGWDMFLGLLRWGPREAPNFWISGLANWAWWPLVVHGLALYAEVRWRRARAFSFSS